ncbi:MAG: glycoside hydrolase family 99-like domain-containing protein [Spirochaetes bacterium]|nr:glycoside hydrolase family 99-like domain-containing protein [Spirochaetota bacterium]
MKIIAFYLPQFHVIPENDEWWGRGFTEWTNVKKAKPLFRGHNQPRIPLNGNYYDLSDINVMKWQSELAVKHGIDGFCFYHYWFDGKLLLEKPVEMYRESSEIKTPYCLSWANEPWTRSWDGKNRNILMKQNYGGMNDILKHFDYLLPFFKDSRYIKINNKPVFLFYRANSIDYFDLMITEWDKLLKKNGFNGLYAVETLTGFQKNKISVLSDASVYMEPMYSLSCKNMIQKQIDNIRIYLKLGKRVSYSAIWNKIIKNEVISNTRFGGAFVDWDNSPRKKKQHLVFDKVSLDLFEKYFEKQYQKSRLMRSPFIFINAWNEWAEGTYLEPDETMGYGFLERIKKIVSSS